MNDNQISLRTATENDIADIMKIELSSFERGVYEVKEIFSERVEIFPSGFYVLQINSKLSGYVCSEMRNYKAKITAEDFTLGHSIKEAHNPQGSELYISSLGVLPSLRGKGWGNTLFSEFLQRMLIKYNNLSSCDINSFRKVGIS